MSILSFLPDFFARLFDLAKRAAGRPSSSRNAFPDAVYRYAPFAPVCAATAIAGLILISGVAQAANIRIDDTNPNGSITITWADFEGGFSVNGTYYAFPGKGISSSLTVLPSGATPQVTFGGSWISTDGAPSDVMLYFVDPGTSHVRDSLRVSSGTSYSYGKISGIFTSDVPTDLGSMPAGGTAVQVTGSPQELVPTYLSTPSGLTFQVVAKLVFSRPPILTLGETDTPENPSASTLRTVNQTVKQAINTATGNTYIKFFDLLTPGRGLRFRFIRAYNDQDPYSGPLCRGWTHSYNILLSVDAFGAVLIKEADGREKLFEPGPAAGSYISPVGVHDVLAKTGTSTYTLTRTDQTVFLFGAIDPNPAIIRLLSITDKNGNAQTLAYDGNGNLKTFTDIGGGTFTFTYDSSGHLTSLHDDQLGRTFHYNCAATPPTPAYIDAAGATSFYSYDSSNLLTVVTDPRSEPAIGTAFDSRGRVTQTTRAVDGATCSTAYSYDDVNRITTITDPRGNNTYHYYDASTPARLIQIVNALGFKTAFAYDANNNITSVTNPLGQTTSYTYDSNGNRTGVTDPLLNVTTSVYDANHNLTSVIDANGKKTDYTYDADGNLTSVTDALAGVTRYTYSGGNRVTFQNANGKTATYDYDSGNRLLSATDPLGHTTTLTYDGFGRLSSQTEPEGNTKSLSYDVLNRLVAVVYTQGSLSTLADPVSYVYDENGNRIRMTEPTGATSYVYDALNRVTSITFPGGRTVAYTYDCNDNRKSMTYAGRTVSFEYDAINRMTAVIDGTRTTTYAYDGADRVVALGYPNGASVRYSYDAAGRILVVENTYTGKSTSNSPPKGTFTYLLDGVGNRTQAGDGSGNVSDYKYDALYRLTDINITGASNWIQYAYDSVGNRKTQTGRKTSIAYSYDDADRMTAEGSTPFGFDKNGNLVTKGSGSAAVTYAYDSANRLRAVSGGGLPLSTFGYDGDGNRVSQTVASGTYAYLNDIATGFSTVLQETGPEGDIFYVRGRGLISADNPKFTYYYHYDAQASVIGLTDTTGHLAQRYAYDVWGTRTLGPPGQQAGTQNKFGYTGEALDPGTSLYYLRARYYDPTLGRFLNKDPLPGFDRLPQSLNRFVYARNNPATLTDRTGRCSEWDGYFDCDYGSWYVQWPGGYPMP